MTTVELKQHFSYLIGKEHAEGCVDNLAPEYISKVLNVPLEDVKVAKKQMGM